jgi:hypothetical protein
MDTAVPHNVDIQNRSVERIDILGVPTVFEAYRWNRK